MSNQVYSNQVQRYRYNKENAYQLPANKAVPKNAKTLVDFSVVDTDEIGPGLSYVAGVFKVVEQSGVGLYHFGVSAIWLAIVSPGIKEMWIEKNAETKQRGYMAQTLEESSTTIDVMVDLRLGDEVRIYVEENGTADGVIIDGIQTHCTVTLVN